MKTVSKKINSYVYMNYKELFLVIVSDIFSALSLVMWSLFMKGLTDVASSRDMERLFQLLVFGGAYLIFSFIINHFQCYSVRTFIRKINCQLKEDLFNAILGRNINEFTEANSARYISILNNDVVSLENNYFTNVPNILENIITFIVASIALFIYNPLVGIVTILLSIIELISPMIVGRKISEKQADYMGFLEKYNGRIKDIFNGFEIIKTFNVEHEAEKLNRESVYAVEDSRYEFSRREDSSRIIQEIITYGTGIIQLAFYIYLVLKGQITLGIFLGSMQISNYVSNPVRNGANEFIKLKAVKDTKIKVENILRGDVSKETIEDTKTISTSLPVEVRNLYFGYDKDKTILNNVSFTFEKGKKYAIVGGSGSGKSTFVKLVMKYYKDYRGEITAGGENLRCIDKGSFSEKVSMIHQRVIIFDDTLRNNITMFKYYPEEKIMEAVASAGLSAIVRNLEAGLDTRVHEGGNNFSGGELQRISIARAFLRNAEMIIMDEATSSLDNENAMNIENAILERKDITVLVVTHKLVESILRKYDCILVFSHGEIIEVGQYEELMKKKGMLYSLYTVSAK